MNESLRLPWHFASLSVWFVAGSVLIALSESAQGSGAEDSLAVGYLFSVLPAFVWSCLFFPVFEKSVRRVRSFGQPGSERPIPIGDILDLLLTELLDRAVAVIVRPAMLGGRHE